MDFDEFEYEIILRIVLGLLFRKAEKFKCIFLIFFNIL